MRSKYEETNHSWRSGDSVHGRLGNLCFGRIETALASVLAVMNHAAYLGPSRRKGSSVVSGPMEQGGSVESSRQQRLFFEIAMKTIAFFFLMVLSRACVRVGKLTESLFVGVGKTMFLMGHNLTKP